MKPEFDYASIRCTKCNDDDTEFYSTDEIDFCFDNTGHYYVDMYCKNCGHKFRAYFKFKYYVTEAHTSQ